MFHTIWSGIFRVDTSGVGALVKDLIGFCAPKQELKIMAQVSVERSWEFSNKAGVSKTSAE